MAISNYSELKTAVSNWTERTDLSTRDAEFIDMAEQEMNNDLRARDMISSATINPSTSNKFVSLPTGFLEIIAFNDDIGDELDELPMEDIEYWRYGSAAARPRYYAITSRIEFERKAASSVNYTMVYYQRLDIANDTTNAILTNHPNVYLYGALSFAWDFLADEERASYYRRMFRQYIDRLNHRNTKSKRKLRTDISNRDTFNILRGW